MKKLLLSFVLIAFSILAFAQLQTAPEWVNVTSNQPETFRTQLISSTEKSVQVNVQVPGFYTTTVTTPNGQAKVITMPKAISTSHAGEPDVPMTGIPVMIGDRARMNVRVLDAQYMDFENIEIAPSKGDFSRQIDPETVPYIYGECYNQDAFFPAQNVEIREPYILRDLRGQNMAVYPFAYNPVTKTLRVYYNMTVEMYKVDDNGANAFETRRSNELKMDQDFKSMYQRHFINYEAAIAKYTPLDEQGDLLIICYDNFISSMTDFVNWKKTRGINTTIVGTSTAGSTYSAIKNYIQSQYNANNNLTHVLLVGDVAQIPGYSYSGGGSDYSGLGDNAYGQVAGSDIYNDVIIGRFSASTAARVTTQCQRAITYERDLTTSASWLQLAEGISRKENGSGHNSEDDYQHMDNIRTDLLNYGYTTVYQRYANLTGYTSTSAQISSDINSGVGIINYANHGQETAWGANQSGYIYYANSHVNALTNENKLPFIFSVACLVGKYDHSSDCFAEAWLNATNNNNPTGAVGALMSYISQPWIPPMWAQDECIDILVESYTNNKKYSFGGISINGLMGIFDHYSTSEQSAVGTYQAWIVYGDPTLMVRTKTPQAMTVTHNGTITPSDASYSVTVSNGNGAVATITDSNHNILGKATVNNGTANVSVNGTLAAGQELTLCVFGYNKVTYLGTITVAGGTQYTITANANNASWGTVTGGGQYYNNTECTLTATANHGYAFDHWSLNNAVASTEASYTFTVTGDAAYTAVFRQLTQHHITYAPQQTNGTIGVSPVNAYAGDIVTLTATPAAGYCLDHWDVNTVGGRKRGNITVVNNQFVMPDAEVTISATFKSGYTVSIADVANGTITATPTSALSGETITLTATPDTGCEFSTWYVYKTGDPTTLVAVVNNSFTMPSYDVTVSAVFATTTSGDVTIGSGTSAQYEVPLNNYYNYSLTQQIYTVAEVGEAGTITKVAFYVSQNAASRNIDIYMIPTTKTAFSSTTNWDVMSSVFKVYSGTYTFTTGWNVITLDTPYEYDGVKNINLGVVDNTGSCVSSSSNAMRFYVYSTSANRALRVRNDNNAYSVGTSQQISSYTGSYVTSNPQVKFTKVIKNNVSLTVSPEAINDFSYPMGMGPTEAQAVSIVGADLSADITVTAPTDFEVSVSAAGTYSGSVTIPHTVASKGGGIRTVTDWGFEGSMQSWTAIDSDGDGYNWVLGSATSGVYLEEGSNVTDQVTGHNGSSDMMVSGSWTDATTTALTPDNWLVSPQVELGGSFSLWARPFYTTYFPEHFGIYVSTTSNSDVNSFTLLGEWTLGAEDYKQYSVDLHAYQGQSGYIAVRHFNCTDNFCILVDDFQLDTDAAYNPEFPVTVTSATVYVRMKADLGIGDYSGNMTVVSGTLNKTVALGGVVEPNGGEQYTITVNASPVEGGTVTGAGTYYEQSRVTLTATPATHYTFEGWQLNGTTVSTSASYQITVTGDAAYTAVFAPMTAHNVAITQPTGGAIVSDLATAYVGDVVTVTYTVESGYFFVEWTVVDGNSQPVAFTIDGQSAQFTMPDSDVAVTASFITGYNVTLNQTEHGTISADQTTNLQPGALVTLTAIPDNGCVFMAWYAFKTGNPRDVVSVISNQYILMPSSDVTVQAIFVTEEEHEANLGSGTNTNNYIPTYTRAKYSLTQQIYLASELDNKNGRITKIAYRAGRTTTRSLTIYMAHTDKSEFSSTTNWEVMGSVAKVFEGSVSFSNSDWTTITLDTPFEFDGTSNINICVVDNSNSTTTQNTGFYRYGGTNRALYANGSSSYANTVGYSNQLSSTTGTRISYVSQIHITMMVPGSAESLTLSPGEMSDLSYVENHGPSHTDKLDIVGVDLQNNITLNAPANFEISLTEDGTYTSSVTVPRETGSKGNRMDVRTVTSWGFEDGLDGWTAVDADNDGYGWVLGSAVGGVYLEEGSSLTEGHTGTGLVVSGSYTNVSGDALTPDNWLISPQITQLGGSFSMWAKAQQAAYPAEHFGIYVSTTGTNPSDFTLLDEWTLTSATWKQFSVDLGLYTGQQGYIAVRHFNCTDQFMIDVDDFELDTEASITIEMPVVVTPATVYVRMKGTLNPGSYSGTLTGAAGSLNGSVSLSGVVIAEYDITVAASPAEGGTVRGAGAYADGTSVTVRAAANEGYAFVNWTEDDVEVSTDAEYTFTVTADRDLVANFELATVEQEITLVQGYNWFTPAVEINLADLETALGENGVSIMTKDESVTYYAGYGWWGDDIVIVPGQMYKIQTTTACSITLSGQPAEIMDHAVTLNRGYNWIGYFGAQNMSLVSALANLQPEDGDVIMDKDLSATYYAGYGWWGDLETLVPGKGYLYKSNANVTKTFYYPSSSK